MEKGIKALLAEEKKPKRGRKHIASKWIEMVGADVAAYMTLRCCLDHIVAGSARVREVAFDISHMVLDELRYRRFREKAPGLFKYRMNSFDTSHYGHRARSLNATMTYANIDISDLDLGDRERLLLGMKLIDVFVTCTSLATVESKLGGKHGRNHNLLLVPDAETLAWLNTRNAKLELLHPVYLPMLVPPMDWEPGRRGGYRFGLRGKYALARGSRGETRKINESAALPVLREALNRIQSTPWRINTPVLRLLADMAERQMLPGTQNSPLPPKPKDIAENDDAKRKWKRAASAVKAKNFEALNKRVLIARMLSVAGMFADDVLYFPSNLDFRGRIYPIPNFLNPQGDDMQKGLLLFDEAVPLGKHGLRFLALHGANCLDTTPQGVKMSSLTLDERIDWIRKHSKQIAQVADDPMEHRWWMNTDSPFCFYAFALEWTRIHRAHKPPHECKSALPVSQDGTCNGVQHFSALLRDPVGGAAVNLLPTLRPNDLYQRIADDCRRNLEADAARPRTGGDEETPAWALLWLASGTVNRALCKRPAMTFGYGSRRFGFSTQIVEYIKSLPEYDKLKDHFSYEKDGKKRNGLKEACSYLSEVIWDCLRERVVAAFDGMEWMRACVKAVAVFNIPVEWTVPGTGLRVRQDYFKAKAKRVNTIIGGQLRRPEIYEPTAKVRAEKQANAVSPNFIHSLDAAVLMFTVVKAAQRGVTHFGMVHDSYATQPGHAQALYEVTREAFVEFYETYNPINLLYEEFRGRLQEASQGREDASEVLERLPSPPVPGSLDIRQVLESPYFFA